MHVWVAHGPLKLAPPHHIRKIFVCQILRQAICQGPKDTIYKLVSSLVQTTAPREACLRHCPINVSFRLCRQIKIVVQAQINAHSPNQTNIKSYRGSHLLACGCYINSRHRPGQLKYLTASLPKLKITSKSIFGVAVAITLATMHPLCLIRGKPPTQMFH